MRRYHRISALSLVLLLFLASAFLLAAVAHGQRPGSPLYRIRDFAEQTGSRLTFSRASRAERALGLAERRASSLAAARDTSEELFALAYASAALDRAALDVAAAPATWAGTLNARFAQVADSYQRALASLVFVRWKYPATYYAFADKLITLKGLIASTNSGKLPESAFGGIAGILVPFSEGFAREIATVPPTSGKTGERRHAGFPLIGRHAALDCQACHTSGIPDLKAPATPESAPRLCIGCHQQDRPATHASNDCGVCHTPIAWRDIRFDHLRGSAGDCASCHLGDKPLFHARDDCASCHDTDAWKGSAFDHVAAGFTNCQGCHSTVRPADHPQDQCSECHTAGALAWRPIGQEAAARDASPQEPTEDLRSAQPTPNATSEATPTTTGFTHPTGKNLDCLGCHASKRPTVHFPGQCSQCHAAGTAWKPARFDHKSGTSLDCQGCHASKRPASHFPGQCSQCHTAGTAWKPARFNHASGTSLDCQGCHAAKRPANHYQGQCSACHDTSAWLPAHFDHQGVGSDCQACHEAQRPANHLQGQCSDCHSAGTSWIPSTISHRFPMDHHGANSTCTTCHPSATRDWSCSAFHDLGRLAVHHSEKGITSTDGLCMNCHPDGSEPDD